MNQDIIERNKVIFKEIEEKYNCDHMKKRRKLESGMSVNMLPELSSLSEQMEMTGKKLKHDYNIAIFFLSYNEEYKGLEVLRYNVENPYYVA